MKQEVAIDWYFIVAVVDWRAVEKLGCTEGRKEMVCRERLDEANVFDRLLTDDESRFGEGGLKPSYIHLPSSYHAPSTLRHLAIHECPSMSPRNVPRRRVVVVTSQHDDHSTQIA